MKFIPKFDQPDSIAENSNIICFSDNSILLKKDLDNFSFPNLSEMNEQIQHSFCLGKLNQKTLWAIDISSINSEKLTNNLISITVREAFSILTADQIKLIGTAFQLLNWHKTTNYCANCGKSLVLSTTERAKICESCDTIYYPRINPSIIVSIKKEDQILLARSPRFPEHMYSVIAGFTEVGENLEECVSREIKEEVGVKVKNIQYFKSQNWPFPNSLMVAFTADYDSGDIEVDNDEIVDAKWFSRQDLPSIPSNFSVAGQLINAFLDSL